MELDPKFLDMVDITCVVTCIGGLRPEHRVDSEYLQGSRLPDKAVQHINFCPNFPPDRKRFSQLIKDIQQHPSVLIHCKMGQKRSVITASAIGLATGLYSTMDDLETHLRHEERQLDEREWEMIQQLLEQMT